jgi:hypothetical protein
MACSAFHGRLHQTQGGAIGQVVFNQVAGHLSLGVGCVAGSCCDVFFQKDGRLPVQNGHEQILLKMVSAMMFLLIVQTSLSDSEDLTISLSNLCFKEVNFPRHHGRIHEVVSSIHRQTPRRFWGNITQHTGPWWHFHLKLFLSFLNHP